MIWVRGKVVPDQALQISVSDRVFEHGLGLFETLRTWKGRPALLGRHIERLRRSARALGLPLDDGDLPDGQSVLDLIEANQDKFVPGEEVRLRITLTGGVGTDSPSSSVLWMTATPLPPSTEIAAAVVNRTTQAVTDDTLARHKTLNYWRKMLANLEAIKEGCFDVLFVTTDGLICETSRANIFLVEDRRLLTPGLDGPLLPGVMRALVVERATRMGLEVVEAPLPLERVRAVDEAFLTSSLRGMLPIATLMDRSLEAPGPVTRQLWGDLLPWLESGGTTP